ncbi:hypothetical protein LguiB_029167 [Lonicera macranthoides]
MLAVRIANNNEGLRGLKYAEGKPGPGEAWEAASKAVQDEEATKQKLCEDLNHLVQESSNIQFARLEELKRRIGALNPSRSSTSVPHVEISVFLKNTKVKVELSIYNGGHIKHVPKAELCRHSNNLIWVF